MASAGDEKSAQSPIYLKRSKVNIQKRRRRDLSPTNVLLLPNTNSNAEARPRAKLENGLSTSSRLSHRFEMHSLRNY